MEIGIFGGSFNPVHCGHIALARQLLAAVGLDEVWFMVSPQNPLKAPAGLLPDGVRFRLVRQALAGEPRLVASDYEFGLPRPSYTWTTLCSLSRDYPAHRFSLVIGGDNWQLFPRWYRAADILRHYRVVVYPRGESGVFPGGKTAGHSGGGVFPGGKTAGHSGGGVFPGGKSAGHSGGGVTFVEAELLNVSSTLVRQRVAQGLSVAGLVPKQIEAAVVSLYAHGAASGGV